MRVRLFLAAPTLLFLLGCQPQVGPAEPFAAWEEGMVLIYEDPSLEGAARFNSRVFKQVVRFSREDGGGRVVSTYSTFQGVQPARLLIRKGGVFFLDGQDREIQMLPEGFPDRVAAWEGTGYRFRIIGRSVWVHPEVRLLSTQSREGIWVEGEPLRNQGRAVRIFYLPGIGEAERLERQEVGGSWAPVNQLVSQGFQEVPRSAPGAVR
ncbi:MAG: hypothetical protein HY823_05945 [Acidobacteria bacterium]|nr:hypothetical protein [Acidobacteriota bacterium]